MPTATVTANELAFIQAHPRGVVKALKPRLHVVKANQIAGKPVNTVAPNVTGTVTVGQVQTSTNGTWLNAPTFTYQWYRRNNAPIPGATAATYTLIAADVGYQIQCEVIATNAAGAVGTRSNYVSP
jgi:hypothetical protein